MDDVDWKILELLQKDARIPLKEMATMLDLSQKEVSEHIKKLRKRNIIRGFKTSIDWRKTGKHIASALIQVKVKDHRVKDVLVATGEYDLIVYVEGKDIYDLSNFVTEKLAPKKDVTGTYTHIVLEEYKRDGLMSFDEINKRLKVSL